MDLFVGNNVGGRLADKRLMPAVLGTIATLAVVLFSMTWLIGNTVTAVSHALDRRLFTGAIGWLTAAASLASLAFITFTSAVPLWLVDAHHLRTDAPLLGGTLGFFSLGAGFGAVAGEPSALDSATPARLPSPFRRPCRR